MLEFHGTLVAREQIASATWAFTLGPGGAEFPFRTGPTIDVTIPDPPHQDDTEPEAFGAEAVHALAAMNVDEDRIRVEEFPGY